MLGAARAWLPSLPGAITVVKSDSLAALRLALRLSSRSRALNKVGMELALDQALSLCELKSLEHVPGLANVSADAVSRIYAPHPLVLPAGCLYSNRLPEASRETDFWRTN